MIYPSHVIPSVEELMSERLQEDFGRLAENERVIILAAKRWAFYLPDNCGLEDANWIRLDSMREAADCARETGATVIPLTDEVQERFLRAQARLDRPSPWQRVRSACAAFVTRGV